MTQSDELNCDLTETNTTYLDQYNTRHFIQNSDTDVYQLYYKNDGSLYCDNLHDAGNKKLVMVIKSDTENKDIDKIIYQNPTSNERLSDYTADSLTLPHSDQGKPICNLHRNFT